MILKDNVYKSDNRCINTINNNVIILYIIKDNISYMIINIVS